MSLSLSRLLSRLRLWPKRPEAGIGAPGPRAPKRPSILSILIPAVLIGGLAVGCGGVSEDELNKIKEENQALAAELDHERRKLDILNQALISAYKERDRMEAALLAPPEPPPAPEGEAAQAPPAEPRLYLVKTGDTLSQIASAHNTTTSTLISLNPYLAQRQDLMVWENDKINLPPN